MPADQDRENSRARSCLEEVGNDAAYPNEEQRENRKNVTDTDLVGANRDYYDVKRDGHEQDHFTPGIHKASSRPNCGQNNGEQSRKSGLKCECHEKVIPPPSAFEFPEQIEGIVLQVVRIDETHISKVQKGSRREQIGGFNHQQRCGSYNEQASYVFPGQTEGNKNDWQGGSGEFTRHCSTEGQSSKNIPLPRWVFASFPKQIKSQNGEYGQGNIRRYQHSVTNEVWTKRVQRNCENTGCISKEIACPHKRDYGSKRREKNHSGTRPEENTIRVIPVQKFEGERVFDAGLPTLFGLVESQAERQEWNCRQQFCQRRMLGIHSEVSRFPIAVARGYVNRLIRSGRQSRYSQHRLNTKNTDEAGGCDV